ncbi:iron reductase domain protein [Aaosphaeria arxii CBS 175.79]|uniref:Iron reductase domain protein n=1 Tax=Aaosphaeria arxii CBS 175.79 TaxID=1450172 RepID=A0A6A5Y8N6_9PLEO|nr:iron reductase domain protein [Aaosphaeria arxii CBS 175.79]KAF2020934.1 iron reductase domain protein [Aaosphaeria arxii CBS 175.79]
MKLSSLLSLSLPLLATAQTAAPYTDAKSGITFNAYVTSNYFFGLALPENATGSDFIGTIGGKGTGWSGASLGGQMRNKLLVLSWPNAQAVLSSFRKTAQYGSPAVATGTFTQTPIANGTYVNSTHWTYTFLCSNCIQTDGTTFKSSDTTASIGFAFSATAPTQKTNAGSAVSKHTSQGLVTFDLTKAKNANFATWKSWAAPKVARGFEA